MKSRAVRAVASVLCASAVIVWALVFPQVAKAPPPDPNHPAFTRPDLSFPGVAEAGDALPQLYSLLVNWRGQMLFEHYFHGQRQGGLANLKSASKSVLAMLIGIAIDRGVIPGVSTPISQYFDDLDPEKRGITVENLLMMRSGLQTTSNRYYGSWVGSPNWVRFALTRPMEATPGERMIYSTGNTHLLSAILTKAAGMSTLDFARQVMAGPLGFDLRAWPTDPQGIYFGGNDMIMTPRQMMMIGETYLHLGKYGGKQIVPQAWVEKSCAGPPRGDNPFGRGRRNQRYGYGWWGGEFDTFKTCYAWGYGGQYIFVMPELDLVIVATSSPYDSEDRRGHRGRLFELIENQIVAPIVDAGEWDRLYARSNAGASSR